MDSDDISKPERLKKQIDFMRADSNPGISGAHMEIIDDKSNFRKEHHKKIGNDAIKISLFFGHTSLAHPSIIIRRTVLDQYHLRYDTAFRYAEDYDLYCRCSNYMILDNYPECLVQYRVHSDSVSQKHHQEQIIDAQAALYLHLRRLKLPFTLEGFKIHTQFTFSEKSTQYRSKEKILSWIDYL